MVILPQNNLTNLGSQKKCNLNCLFISHVYNKAMKKEIILLDVERIWYYFHHVQALFVEMKAVY